jgi:dipeptidyl aminopeptidase/acylaminoacyl peptidase
LAYRAQKRPGFEADRWEILVVGCDSSGKPRGTPENQTAYQLVTPSGLPDVSADEFVWIGERDLLYSAELSGFKVVERLRLNASDRHVFGADSTGYVGVASGLSTSSDGGLVSFLRATSRSPGEIYVSKTGPGAVLRKVTDSNAALLAELDLSAPESIKIPGANDTPMQMWILKPPGFDEKKKWPLVYLVHGGPQGAWEDSWSYRWNPQVWAAQGYVVALPNPRGSTGFGQKYVDEISGDWGGKCYEDLMKGVEYLEKLPYIDKDRMAAAGASFGGYMMNWFAGHTDKFKTLITHCGVYNFDSMYGLTEELWFDEWEHGGPPWLKRDSYEKHSPHKFAKNFKTPMLIIHNDLDFRVPVAEGLQLFTTLQRLGVPSRMVNFPDEGHWVLKPANSKYWHEEVFTWMKKYAPPGGR